jgi:DNA processing protein
MAAIRRARAYLVRVAEPPAPALGALIDAQGPVAAAELVRAGTVPSAVLDETAARRHLDLADDDFAAADAVGARLVIPEDDEWPTRPLSALTTGPDPSWAVAPVAVWARGPARLADMFDNALSILGARAATDYGDTIAADTAYRLACARITVVSGGNYGIEEAACRGALAAGGITAVVSPTGIDIAYPIGNATLLDRIADGGVVITEYPPGTPPARRRFRSRSRLIAALSGATLVVEANARSTAKAAAARAAALGRTVMAVPGPVTSVASAGCHELIRTGVAVLVSSWDEVKDEFDTARRPLLAPLRPQPARPAEDNQ